MESMRQNNHVKIFLLDIFVVFVLCFEKGAIIMHQPINFQVLSSLNLIKMCSDEIF